MFEDLPLHDATLKRIELEWATGICKIIIQDSSSKESVIIFSGVTEVALPREHPWGPSVSINELRQLGTHEFEIEIQSGDALKIRSSGWEFKHDQVPKEL